MMKDLNTRHLRLAAIFCSLLICMIPAFSATQDSPSDKTVEVIGTGAVHGGDVAAARQHAISAALAAAVEQVTHESLPLESLIRHFQVLNHRFYEHTENFVQNFKVLSEASMAENYRVLVQATISVDRVVENLAAAGILSESKSQPNILFVLVEQHVGQPPQSYWSGEEMVLKQTVAESAMIDAMRADGALPVDRKNLAEHFVQTVFGCVPDFNATEAAQLGARVGADIVILGRATAELSSNTLGQDLKSFKGTVAARAVLAGSGEQIAAGSQTAVAVNADLSAGGTAAIAKAGALAGKDLYLQIMRTWGKDTASPAVLRMIVSGTANLAHFVKLRSALEDITGVRNVFTKEMMDNEAVLEVDFEGGMKHLTEALMLLPFESFGINISEVSQSRLRVEILPK